MIPENFKFGGGATESVLHPLVLAAMLIAIVLILALRRQHVIVPFLWIAFMVPVGQQLVIGGLHVFVLRIVILVGFMRMVFSKRPRADSMDKVFLLWAVLRAIAFVLLFSEIGAVTNQLGFLWDTVGGFFLVRFLIQDEEDMQRAAKVLMCIAVFLAACMANERLTGLNIFGYLGSIPLVSTVREGKIRAQGTFAHALLAGTFGATLLPLFVWLWVRGKARGAAMVGVVASTIMTIASAASTPILAYVAAVFAICLWPLRNHMQIFRWGIVAGLVGATAVMKAPVWFLIARIDLAGGSSGYHRALLIDQFIKHFADWWLVGTHENGNWGFDLWDTCNQYVTEGETGGVATLICFIWLLYLAFRRIGVARRAAGQDRNKQWHFWLLGATLFSHVVAFFGIIYFDQTRILWFTVLAIIIKATGDLTAPEAVPENSPVEVTFSNPDWAYQVPSVSEFTGSDWIEDLRIQPKWDRSFGPDSN